MEQAVLVLLAFVIPSVIAWLELGAPTSRIALAALFAAILTGVLLFIKEALGSKKPEPPISTTRQTMTAPNIWAFKARARRLMFLALMK